MTQRITKENVRGTFESFSTIATRIGFDTTGWTLQEGNAYRAWRLYIDSDRHTMGQHPMGDWIGATASEAWNWLSASIHTMMAIEQLNSNSKRIATFQDYVVEGGNLSFSEWIEQAGL